MKMTKQKTGKQDDKKERPKKQVVSVVEPDGFMAETIAPGHGYPLYLITPDEEMGETIQRPGLDLATISDPHGLVEKGVVLLSGYPKPYGSQEQLIADLRAFIHRYVDVANGNGGGPGAEFFYAHTAIPTSAFVDAKIFSPSFTFAYTTSLLAKKGSFGPRLSR